MAEFGPDGNVWVLDWYNYIVQHNPTPNGFETGRGNAYESGLRDKKHGRVYRVVYDAASKQRPLDLSKASPEALVATLSHPTQLWRKHAQRLLVERGQQDVVPGLIKLVADPKIDEIGLNAGAIHALWALPEGDADFSTRWSLIKSGFSRGIDPKPRSVSKVRKREKGIWQRRYWEHAIRDDADLERHVDYIHFNPVKHGHVTRVADWPHSSFHRYVERGLLAADWGGDMGDIQGLFGE